MSNRKTTKKTDHQIDTQLRGGEETQLALPFDEEDWGGRNKIYLDHGRYHTVWRDYSFSSVITPYGIQCLDTEFAKEIMVFAGKQEEFDNLRKRIIHNPHLHPYIKQNLISNLDDRKDQIC